MYTLEQLKGRVIWNFREPRSGSTWFKLNFPEYISRKELSLNFPKANKPNNPEDSNFLGRVQRSRKMLEDANKTGKNLSHMELIDNYFKNRKQESEDELLVITTHQFCALNYISNYSNPIIIRNSRKNITEQFLSEILVKCLKQSQVITQDDIAKYANINPIVIDEQEVIDWINIKKYQDKIWNDVSTSYENETVYYEDLLECWESKIFPVKLSMNIDSSYYPKTNSKNRTTYKIPIDKKEIVVNYEQIDSIIKNSF